MFKKILFGLTVGVLSLVGVSALAQQVSQTYDYQTFNKLIWKNEKRLYGKSKRRRTSKVNAYQKLADKNVGNAPLEDMYDDIADALKSKQYVGYGKFCLTPNNAIIGQNNTITLYKANDTSCTPYTRTCSNRTLGGERLATLQSCQNANSCNLPWGGSIAHNTSITARNSSSSTSCQSQIRTCNNGNLNGNYSNSSCSAIPVQNQSCNLPWGGSIAHNTSITARNSSSSTSCQSQIRICNNGTLNGNYQNRTCTAIPIQNQSCNLPWGGSIAHNTSITARNSSSSTSCQSQIRTCNNGTLNGNYQNRTCTATPVQNQSCTTPRGTSVSNGTNVTARNQQGQSQSKTCTNGSLGFSAGYSYSNQGCIVNIISYPYTPVFIAHGASSVFYRTYASSNSAISSVEKIMVSCDNGLSFSSNQNFGNTSGQQIYTSIPFSTVGSCTYVNINNNNALIMPNGSNLILGTNSAITCNNGTTNGSLPLTTNPTLDLSISNIVRNTSTKRFTGKICSNQAFQGQITFTVSTSTVPAVGYGDSYSSSTTLTLNQANSYCNSIRWVPSYYDYATIHSIPNSMSNFTVGGVGYRMSIRINSDGLRGEVDYNYNTLFTSINNEGVLMFTY